MLESKTKHKKLGAIIRHENQILKSDSKIRYGRKLKCHLFLLRGSLKRLIPLHLYYRIHNPLYSWFASLCFFLHLWSLWTACKTGKGQRSTYAQRQQCLWSIETKSPRPLMRSASTHIRVKAKNIDKCRFKCGPHVNAQNISSFESKLAGWFRESPKAVWVSFSASNALTSQGNKAQPHLPSQLHSHTPSPASRFFVPDDALKVVLKIPNILKQKQPESGSAINRSKIKPTKNQAPA